MTTANGVMACIEIAAADGKHGEGKQGGGPEVLRVAERPVPQPGPGEVLVKVAAAGINRADIMQREGKYPPPPGTTDIPGLEISGHIAAVGDGVNAWSIGTPVCALLAGGGYAEYCVVPAPQLLPIPHGISLVEAAALPETVFTVWANVFERAYLQPGDSFLVHGGSSGIGTTAIQMAAEWGARVFTTAGSAEKCRACEALGAERAINYREEDFVAVIHELTGGRGVDVVLDMVGGDYIARNIAAMAPEGRHVSIAFMQGPKVTINMVPIVTKGLTLTGSPLRTRSVAEKGRLAAEVKTRIWPMVAAGKLRPQVHATFPLAQVAEAHRLMESSAHIGKIVLTAGD